MKYVADSEVHACIVGAKNQNNNTKQKQFLLENQKILFPGGKTTGCTLIRAYQPL